MNRPSSKNQSPPKDQSENSAEKPNQRQQQSRQPRQQQQSKQQEKQQSPKPQASQVRAQQAQKSASSSAADKKQNPPLAKPESEKSEKAEKIPSKPASKNLLFQKVAIFVDAENIEMSGLKHHEGRTDYKKVLDEVGDREIIRILYYKPVYKEVSPDFENFWHKLGGEIRRPTKNADTFLVIDAVTMAEKIDVAIILGGDKDFLPLMWYLKSRGCKVEIWSWPEATSPEVKEAADYYFPLTKDFLF